jgi:hypothetical protein
MSDTKLQARSSKWRLVASLLMTFGLAAPLHSIAEIKLLSDWGKPYPDGTPLPSKLFDEYGSSLETRLSETANWESLRKRIATPLKPDGTTGDKFFGMGYRLHFDKEIYYITALGFMPKTRPDEVCTKVPWQNRPTYKCHEGQRYTRACHIAIYDRSFKEVGWHTVGIDRNYPLYCNTVAGMGRLDATHNDVLVVAQYFRVDDDAGIATRPDQIGQSWHRMTVRLKLTRTPEGRIDIVQDDSCLGNPNDVEEIPEARKLIKSCIAKGKPAAKP